MINQALQSLPHLVSSVAEIKTNMETFEKSLAATATEVSHLHDKTEVIEERLTHLENRPEKCKQDLHQLQEKIALISTEKRDREQWNRLNNIEIKGIPMSDSENLLDIIITISKTISQPIQREQINFITRTRSYTNCKPIIACFLNRYIKEDFLAAAKKFKDLTASRLGFACDSKVHINEHLTPENKKLLTKTKEATKFHGWKFVWTKNGRIQARKNETSKIHIINSDDDIQKMVN